MTNKDILIYAVDGRFTRFGAPLFSALLVILIFVSFPPLVAQGQKVDSLKSLLEREFGPKRQQILFELAYAFTDSDNHLAMAYINQAAKLSDAAGDSLMIVKCGRIKSLLYRRFNQMDSSMILCRKILPIAERNKFDAEVKRVLFGLALGYSHMSNYDKALNCYFRILASTDLEHDGAEAAAIFNNVGLVYFKLNDLDKALSYLNRSLAFRDDTKKTFDVELTFLNIGLCHVYKHNYTAAKRFTDSIFSTCKNRCSKGLTGKAYFNYGLISYGLKQLKLSEKQFLKSYELVKDANDKRYQLDNLIYLFKIYLDTNNLGSAKGLLNDAKALLSTDLYYTQGVMKMYGQLAKMFEKTGDISQVAFYQSKYILIRDSVYTEDLTKNLMRVESEYTERENTAKIDAQTKILRLSNEVISRQRALNIVAWLVAALSIILVFVLIQNVRQKKRVNIVLEQKVKERTIELELNHNLLLKTMQQRNVQFQRMSSEIRSSLATIKGLGVLVSHDVGTINASNYLAKIEETSNNLILGLNRVHDQQI